MTKDELIKDLEVNIYCRLASSPIHGVGVFAIRDIPKGTMPFECDEGDFVEVEESEVMDNPNISEPVKKMLLDFCVFEDGKIYLLDSGMNAMNVSYYLNNSDNPNMECREDYLFYALRDIKAGEELTVNYDTYSDK